MVRTSGLFTILLASTTTLPAAAAMLCATTPAELEAALETAATNGQHDEIRIKAGSYDLSGVDLAYDPPEGNIDLDLSGGRSAFFGNPCGQQLARDAWATTLDGGGAGRILRIAIDSGQADIGVRLLAFTDGHQSPGLGAGLSVTYGAKAGGTVTIERNAFLLNVADQAAALAIQGGSLQYVVNNLFVLNQAGSRAAAYLATSAPLGVSFTNNTVLAHSHDNGQQPAVSILAGRVLVANNHLWDNDGHDLDLGATGDRFLYHNNFESLLAHGGEVAEGNISVEPEYEGGFLDYTPARGSVLVDAGREPQGSLPLWYIAALDFEGAARVVGAHVDIGAFENETIFVDGFEVSGPFR